MSGNLSSAASAGASALDIALVYDPVRRGCDLCFANGDIQVDLTPVTAMLMALGCDRRARLSDALPEDGNGWAQGEPLADLKRGWAGDALDSQGRRIGSRLWLLERAKADEASRKFAEGAAGEALDLVSTALDVPIQLTVRYVAPAILGYRAVSGKLALNISQPVAG
jgi:phage gp46-like protein